MKYCKENIGVFRLSGNDVIDFLQRVSTNDMRNLKDNGINRTVLLNEKGKIVDFVTVLKFDDVILLISSKGNETKIKDFFEKYIVTDDVSFAQENVDIITFIPVFNIDYKYLMELNYTEGNYLFFDAYRFDKIIVLEYNPDSDYLKLMISKSKSISYIEFKNIAINKFYVYDSNELNKEINPLECGLKEFISFEKGCYIGQEVISRLDTQGKIPKMMVAIKAEFPIDIDDKIYCYDSGVMIECGFVSSTGFSDSFITALGFIRGKYFNERYQYYINNDVNNVVMINQFKY